MSPPEKRNRRGGGGFRDLQQGSLAGGLPDNHSTADGSLEVSPDHQTCDLRELPAGGWMFQTGTWIPGGQRRWRLALPVHVETEQVLVCLAMDGEVRPIDVGMRGDTPRFLRAIAWLLDAGYPLVS
ncbi:MAG: hypothetical protein ABI142_03050, partial [Bryocella sp.]